MGLTHEPPGARDDRDLVILPRVFVRPLRRRNRVGLGLQRAQHPLPRPVAIYTV
jgi:hypothetical protein